ncbi:hypothetical protein CEE69_12520 [Rhodopirellula bahusiensis]|uniref:Uncharacterized protein n=1 Tax=Rhodopirellula bahusiensis TaxID=2014065 RepID=A0A2G1W8R1_9BACT|nr:hypothetical protein CEE69_12520 [Rhodopirellula bahusiensis]
MSFAELQRSAYCGWDCTLRWCHGVRRCHWEDDTLLLSPPAVDGSERDSPVQSFIDLLQDFAD